MEHLDGPFSLAALPYSQMNELLSRSGDRMYSRPNDPPPPPPLMHPLGEIKPPSVIRWEPLVCLPPPTPPGCLSLALLESDELCGYSRNGGHFVDYVRCKRAGGEEALRVLWAVSALLTLVCL